MKEYIDRDRLKNIILDEIESCGEMDASHRPIAYGYILGLKYALLYAKGLPAENVVHGKWVVESEYSIRCPICCFNRASIKIPLNYCPHCGARMDGGK